MASITDRLPFPRRGDEEGDQEDMAPDSGHTPDGHNDDEDPEFFLEMSLQEHLEELRTRMLYSVIAVAVALIAGFLLAFRLIEEVAVKANVPNEEIQTISPTEGFVSYFKVALYIAVALAMPVLVYQLIAFVAPGLTRRERGYVYRAIPVVTVFFIAGIAFAFFVVIPRALDFLSNFGNEVFAYNPRAEEVISFYVRLMIGIGAAFQLPVLMYLIARIELMSYRAMIRIWKWAFILILLASAIITPTPDPFNMMFVAVPLAFLYLMGIGLAWIANPRGTTVRD